MVISINSMDSRYQIQEQINHGGVGVVFRAWDTRLQRSVAIKRFLAPELRSDGGAIDPDLMREATVLSAMQHPNIVSIHDVLPDSPDGPCVIMEFLNGKDLEQTVSEAAMTLPDFYQVAAQTLDALNNAHRLNLLHRDIKPANIQVSWLANGSFICKFVDFGLARFFQQPSCQTVRPDGTVMGSVYYMAPEQLERLPLDGRSDLYSLGCVFYFLLSMHRPFEGSSVQNVIRAHLHGDCQPLQTRRPELPASLCRWVHWLMERHPARRPANAANALTLLQQIQQGQPPLWPDRVPSSAIPAPRPPLRPRRKRKRSALRWILPALGAAALLSIGSAAALLWQHWQSPEPALIRQTAASLISAARQPAPPPVPLKPSRVPENSMRGEDPLARNP